MKIDWWTLGLQAVNVLILVWLLQHFFWRPVAAMIEQRRVAAQKALDDAEAKDKQATAALAETEKTRAGFAAEREAILAAAHKEADAVHSAAEADNGKQADAAKAAATAAIEQEKMATGKAWAASSSQLAIEIAQRLAGRLNGTAVQAAFLDWLLAAVHARPDIIEQANGAILDVTTAEALEPTEQMRYGPLICAALGAQPQLAFKVDPALIAGLELSGPNFTVSNSWRADLAAIQADLVHAT